MFMVGDGDLVIPGQLIGENVSCLDNCFMENNRVYSMVFGMVRINGRVVRVIPSLGVYTPKRDDLVIGVIINVMEGSWIVDINSPYLCRMRGEEVTKDVMNKNLSKYYDVGDRISAKISFVNEVNSCEITGPWKLIDGVIINVNPKRIPRVVGKRRSMLEILKKKTNCNIVVGQNGRIWVRSDNFDNVKLAINAIKRIEREAQSSGLTDRIEKMLENARRS
ncbi:MAG: RNA-binding protein [Candidatus Altiarchaeales archaeon]|nr:MAG: RNA-binding protein [Candidatus Altiarchaeales archaeon]